MKILALLALSPISRTAGHRLGRASKDSEKNLQLLPEVLYKMNKKPSVLVPGVHFWFFTNELRKGNYSAQLSIIP